jgi:prepilin-type N-terminal cleavage/methylation domain-containing protein
VWKNIVLSLKFLEKHGIVERISAVGKVRGGGLLGNTCTKSAFNLLELIIVVVIVSLITAFTTAGYARFREKTRAKEAQMNLISLYNAEKRYKLDTGAYYGCASSCTLSGIEGELGVLVEDPYFT